MFQSDLCNYSNACIVVKVKGTITVEGNDKSDKKIGL